MAANCRFAFAVHILAVLAYKRGGDVSSEVLANSVNTNAVVVRRILSDLRRAGLVATCRGSRGGARLAMEPGEIALNAVYHAVGSGTGLSPHAQHPNVCCPVGKKIEQVLHEVFGSAQAALEAALGKRTVADVLETAGIDAPRLGALPEGRA